MNIFVTGGAGFIGREVVKQLLQRSHNVYIYDDFSFGKKENIKEFNEHKQFTVEKGKIEDHPRIFRAMKKFKPEIVLHLAALHYIPYCNTHPLETIRVNVEGCYSVLDASSKLNVRRILFASSGALYSSEEHPLVEGKDLPKPVDVYGSSKLLGEIICEYFSRTTDLEIIAIRFFNTFGPYETNKHLIPEIMEQLHIGDSVHLGNLKTKRDYIFTEDIAKAIILISQSTKTEKYKTVNIGSGKEYSAKEIILIISKLLGRTINIINDPNKYRKSDKLHQIASIELLEKIIYWQPSHSLEEGLKKLLKYESLI